MIFIKIHINVLLVRRYAEHMTKLRRLKVKVMVFNCEFHVHSISHQPFVRFSLTLKAPRKKKASEMSSAENNCLALLMN